MPNNTVGIKLPEEALVGLECLIDAAGPTGVYEGSIADELLSHPRLAPYLVTGQSASSLTRVYDILRHLKKARLYEQVSAHPHSWRIKPLDQAIERPEPIMLENRERALKVYDKFIEKVGYEKVYRGRMSDFIEENGLDRYFCDENGCFDVALQRRTVNWLHNRNALFPLSRSQTLILDHPDKFTGKKLTKPPRRRTDMSKPPYGPIDPASITGATQESEPAILPQLREAADYSIPDPMAAQPRAVATPAPAPTWDTGGDADLQDAVDFLTADDSTYVQLVSAVATKFMERHDQAVQQVGHLLDQNDQLQAENDMLQRKCGQLEAEVLRLQREHVEPEPKQLPAAIENDTRRRAAELLKRLGSGPTR